MPDHYGFDHLPWWGAIEVRCIEEGCSDGGQVHLWPEKARRRHARAHEAERRRGIKRQRVANVAKARRLKRLAERENEKVYA